MTGVMAGIRILEVAEQTFVPVAAAVLADWGADVIKVEHVERGDAMRGLVITGRQSLERTVHVLLEHSNRGKRSIALDLSTPEGQEIIYRLAETADVFLTNKAPGVRQRLRIDVDDIRAHNPRIVYVRGSAWGANGPEADRGGYDMLGFWVRSGAALSSQERGADRIPMMPGPAYGDSIGGMNIAGGIAAALLHRERTGESPVVDVSLLGSGVWAMGPAISLSHQTGQPWGPLEPGGVAHPLSHTYRCGDGRFLTMNTLQGQAYWAEFCTLMGLEELIDDPRFATQQAMIENGRAGADRVAEVFASAPFAQWQEKLSKFSGQWAPVLDSVSITEDEQVRANGYLVEQEVAGGETYMLATAPVQFDGEVPKPARAPGFNEHGDAILEELGLDWERIVELKVNGVVA
jgi:crotonobetainyl-CoA:carnitine CoA-transferase CaiB-like acyl-CoA transferase